MKAENRFISNLEAFNPILDVPVPLLAELDHRTMSFGELFKLEIGSLVSLSRPSGENIELYIGDVLLGSGEIVVVDGALRIRVADLRDKSGALPATPRLAEELD